MALTTIPTTFMNCLLDICVNTLLERDNSVTTLDLKNEFRNNYKNIYIDQKIVSGYLNSNYTRLNLSYTDNGSYRTYFVYNNDSEYYNSETKGKVKIADMHTKHLLNALVKQMSEFTNLSKDTCRQLINELLFNNSTLGNLFREYQERDDS